MATYQLFFNTGASASVTVQADSEDEAIDLAYDALPHDVCAQCGGWGQKWSLDLGEWDLDDTADAIREVDSDD